LQEHRISDGDNPNQFIVNISSRLSLPEHNQRVTCAAAEVENYHRLKPGQAELEEAFRLESECSISTDWTERGHSKRASTFYVNSS
jgi:hypothetical protein